MRQFSIDFDAYQRPGICHGLFGGGNSETILDTTNNAYDNRIGVGGGEGAASLVQIGEGGSLTVTNQTVDPGVLALAGVTTLAGADVAKAGVDAARDTAGLAIAGNSDVSLKAIQGQLDATKLSLAVATDTARRAV